MKNTTTTNTAANATNTRAAVAPVATISPEQLAALKERANAENERVRNDRFAAAVAAMLSTSTDTSALSVLYAARLPVLKVDEQGKTTTVYRPANLSQFMTYLRKNDHKERAADMAESIRAIYDLLLARHLAPVNDTAAPSKSEVKAALAAFVARYGVRKSMPVTSAAVNVLLDSWVKVRATSDTADKAVTVSATVRALVANLPAVLQGMVTGFSVEQTAAAEKQKDTPNKANAPAAPNKGKQGKSKQTAAPAPVAKDTADKADKLNEANKADKANAPAA